MTNTLAYYSTELSASATVLLFQTGVNVVKLFSSPLLWRKIKLGCFNLKIFQASLILASKALAYPSGQLHTTVLLSFIRKPEKFANGKRSSLFSVVKKKVLKRWHQIIIAFCYRILALSIPRGAMTFKITTLSIKKAQHYYKNVTQHKFHTA